MNVVDTLHVQDAISVVLRLVHWGPRSWTALYETFIFSVWVGGGVVGVVCVCV